MHSFACLAFLTLVSQVQAVPRYYSEGFMQVAGCTIPQKGYDNHGDPVENDDILFTLDDSKGSPVTAWDAGEEYHLTTAQGSGQVFQALVVASIGSLDILALEGKSEFAVGFQSASCENAWGSHSRASNHTMRWQPPEQVPAAGLCVEFSTAHATSGSAAYQVNTVKICSSGHEVESTSNAEQESGVGDKAGDTPKLRGRGHLSYGNGLHGLNWTHGLLLTVLTAGVVAAVVYKTSKEWKLSGGSYASVIDPMRMPR